MTQEELWQNQWQEYMDFIEKYQRRPSKHRLEEHKLLAWYKHNRQLINKGKQPADRLKKFNVLMEAANRVQRINQFQYVNGEKAGGNQQGKRLL
ncbi:MAG: hypothetical protein ACOYJG_06835 [Prevotella sp.]|jgi:hypothetical protein